jgi:hypothetical protein
METRATTIGYLELEITTFEKIKDFEYIYIFYAYTKITKEDTKCTR